MFCCATDTLSLRNAILIHYGKIIRTHCRIMHLSIVCTTSLSWELGGGKGGDLPHFCCKGGTPGATTACQISFQSLISPHPPLGVNCCKLLLLQKLDHKTFGAYTNTHAQAETVCACASFNTLMSSLVPRPRGG